MSQLCRCGDGADRTAMDLAAGQDTGVGVRRQMESRVGTNGAIGEAAIA